MATEEKKEEQKEVVPEWVTKMQESLDSLPDRLREALTPEQVEEPELTETEPLEIPVPQPQPQDPPPQPQEIDPQPQQQEEQPKKKKGFLDWFL